jgi:hypothetical protein
VLLHASLEVFVAVLSSFYTSFRYNHTWQVPDFCCMHDRQIELGVPDLNTS